MAENSVITRARRINLCNATSKGSDVSPIAPIDRIAFGDGGVDDDGNPIPPLDTATALNNQIAIYPIDEEPVYPEPTTARYTATIPAADLAGEVINEAAIVDSNGQLCAIKTMFVKRKDSGVAFTFTFDDEF